MLPESRRRSFLDPAVVARLAALPLLPRRPMVGTVSGRHPSPHRGASVEFAEYRKYVAGDDLRRLDWRAHGRTDRYYVKEFEADTNLRLCVVLDTSGSMDFSAAGTSKIQYARQLAAALGYLAVLQGDAVGLSCVGEGISNHIPPRRNPAHLMHLFDALEAAKPSGPTRLPEALHELAERVRQRALVVIISDLFLPPESLRDCFAHLRFCKHDVAVFHLLDRQEIDFQFQRPVRFLDMEGGPPVFAEPNEIADRYQKAMAEYLQQLTAVVHEAGVDYHRVVTDEQDERVLTRFLVGRTRTRGVR